MDGGQVHESLSEFHYRWSHLVIFYSGNGGQYEIEKDRKKATSRQLGLQTAIVFVFCDLS